jgi:ribosomal protein S17
MKNISSKISTLLLAPVAALLFSSCSNTPDIKGQSSTVIARQKGVPGIVALKTFRAIVTVTAINPVTRKITLRNHDGSATSYTAGPNVVNFNQIKVGDTVKINVAEEFAASVHKKGAPQKDTEATEVALAKRGGKPGVFVTNTQKITARVTAIDTGSHEVTLKYAAGDSETVKVGNHVNLANVKVGDIVVIRVTRSVEILVEKP